MPGLPFGGAHQTQAHLPYLHQRSQLYQASKQKTPLAWTITTLKTVGVASCVEIHLSQRRHSIILQVLWVFPMHAILESHWPDGPLTASCSSGEASVTARACRAAAARAVHVADGRNSGVSKHLQPAPAP